MERRSQIVVGAIGTVLAIIFLTLLVRSCGRDTTSSVASDTVTVTNVEGSSPNLKSCTPDAKTGYCYPRSGNVVMEEFPTENFVARIQDIRSSAAASGSTLSSRSSRRSSNSRNSSSYSYAEGSFFDRLFGDRSLQSSSSSTRSRTSNASSVSSASAPAPAVISPEFAPKYVGEDTATLEIIGGSGSSRGRSSSQRSSIRSSSSHSNASARSSRSSSRSSIRVTQHTANGDDGEMASDLNDEGNAGEFSGESDGGSVTIVGDSDEESGGSVGITSRGRCDRSRSLLSIFDFGEITTGEGVTFPDILLNGDCPISAGILKVNVSGTFGGPLDF